MQKNSLVKVWPLATGIRGLDANQVPMTLVLGKPGWLTEARFAELEAVGQVMKMAGARWQDLQAASAAYETRHVQAETAAPPPITEEEEVSTQKLPTSSRKKVAARKKATYRRRDMTAEKPT